MQQEHASSVVKPVRVLVGAKPPLRPSHVWSIRTQLQIEGKKRNLTFFNQVIDSKLRGCDVVAVRVDDGAASGYSMGRETIRQKKTGRPVCFGPVPLCRSRQQRGLTTRRISEEQLHSSQVAGSG